tara:strand:+ start:180 stop:338 length:159 start_codon:yes stop_codon:yes gene_type:complete
MELFICNVDGSELTQITTLGQINWSLFFRPSGEKVIFLLIILLKKVFLLSYI